jgi:hypothetical protein
MSPPPTSQFRIPPRIFVPTPVRPEFEDPFSSDPVDTTTEYSEEQTVESGKVASFAELPYVDVIKNRGLIELGIHKGPMAMPVDINSSISAKGENTCADGAVTTEGNIKAFCYATGPVEIPSTYGVNPLMPVSGESKTFQNPRLSEYQELNVSNDSAIVVMKRTKTTNRLLSKLSKSGSLAVTSEGKCRAVMDVHLVAKGTSMGVLEASFNPTGEGGTERIQDNAEDRSIVILNECHNNRVIFDRTRFLVWAPNLHWEREPRKFNRKIVYVNISAKGCDEFTDLSIKEDETMVLSVPEAIGRVLISVSGRLMINVMPWEDSNTLCQSYLPQKGYCLYGQGSTNTLIVKKDESLAVTNNGDEMLPSVCCCSGKATRQRHVYKTLIIIDLVKEAVLQYNSSQFKYTIIAD